VAAGGVALRRPWLRRLAVLALAGSAACRQAPRACYVTGVSVTEGLDPAALRSLGIDRDDLRHAASAALGRAAGFRVPPAEPGKGARLCRATVALVDARASSRPGGGPEVEALVGLDVAPGEDAEGVRELARYAEPVRAGEDPRAALLRAIEGAVGRAADVLALAFAEGDKPEAEVVRDLGSSDPRMRDLAVRVLAERRSPAAVPALLTRLSDADPEVVERAVGALAQIRDPRAVGPLIDLTHRREGPFVTQLVFIIGDIGGPEAEAYLETLAAGHPEPTVKQAARDALATLRRRGSAPGR